MIVKEIVIIDISGWNGVLNWVKAKSNIHAAIIKVGQGVNNYDGQFVRNWSTTKSLGIPRAGYWYLKPDKDGKKQCESFLAMFKNGYDGDFCPWLDVEERSASVTKNMLVNCYEKFITTWWNATNNAPIGTYTSIGFWDVNWPFGASDMPKKTKLWVAHWDVADPAIPREWKMANVEPSLWQYSADGNNKGSFYGGGAEVGGDPDMDLDTYYGTLEEFNKEFHLSVGPLQPPPPPPPIVFPHALYFTSAVINNTVNIRTSPNATSTGNIVGTLKHPARPIAFEEKALDAKTKWVRIGSNIWCIQTLNGKEILSYE